MPSLLAISAVLIPGMFRVGGLRIPIFGIFAAAGIIAALWLSQRTAPMARLSANQLWDAGVVAVAAAFIASRLLLIALDFRAFVRFPMFVLALPSLTYGGLAVTALVTYTWLRVKHLPILDVLDAWAPCAALLAAVLSFGHFMEGTEGGMPTRLPWGVHTPGDSILGRVHPVQIYAMIVALALCEYTLIRLRRRKISGEVAARALAFGGLASFLLDFLRQPVESLGHAYLDPGQWVAILAMLAGGILWTFTAPKFTPTPKVPLTREEFASLLENFVNGGGGDWDWETMAYERFTDPLSIEAQRQLLDVVPVEHPAGKKNGYCSEDGLSVLRTWIDKLRDPNTTPEHQ